MKRNRFATWFQSTIYVQEKGHEDSEMQMKKHQKFGFLTDGSKLGSPAQDSWATIVASKKEGDSDQVAPQCTIFSSFYTTKNYTGK